MQVDGAPPPIPFISFILAHSCLSPAKQIEEKPRGLTGCQGRGGPSLCGAMV